MIRKIIGKFLLLSVLLFTFESWANPQEAKEEENIT